MDGQPKRILVIDDSEDLRDACQMLFESAGYAVATADNGQAGLGAVRSFRPDVVLLDVAMPVMDGLEFLYHLRSDFAPPLPAVIACSGFGTAGQAAIDGGAYAFVLKPVALGELLELVQSAIDAHAPSPELLVRGRDLTTRARAIKVDVGAALLRRAPFEQLIGSVRWVLERARAYFDADDAFAAVMRDERLTILNERGARETPHADTSVGEVILSGSTLVLSDITKHTVFAHDLAEFPEIRSVLGVPVVTPTGATVGALCLVRNEVRPFAHEDVLILQTGAARAASLIERVTSGEPDPFHDFPFVLGDAALARETFQLLVEMELRLAQIVHEPVELAIVDAAGPITPAAIQAAHRAVEPKRWAIGGLGPRRLALFKRGNDATQITRQIDAATTALRSVVPLSGVGAVSVDGRAAGALDASMLFLLADRQLASCDGSSDLERLLLVHAPTASTA